MTNCAIEDLKIVPFTINYIEDVSEMHFQIHDGWSMKSLISDIANTATQSYVAVAGGRAVGFCSYLVTDDAELLFVCTHPSFRKMGIATKLLTETIDSLPPKITSIVLEVRSKNQSAVNLYEKLGFGKLGIRKNFYSTPMDDAIVMEYTKGGKALN